MYRFYIEPEQVQGDEVIITGGDVNHMKNVLRLEPGEWVVACDKKGTDYVSRVKSLSKEEVILQVEKVQDTGTELPGKIYLFQGLPKQDKMELIIQKAVELGVYQVIPVMMNRCVVKLKEQGKIQKKQKRWQGIAEAAAKQCDRGIIPEIHTPVSFSEALALAEKLDYTMIPYELQQGINQSKDIVAEACKQKTIGIFIGPEGGLEETEVAQAVAMGAKPVTLGKRILRTETAGMTMLSIMMFQMQEE